MLLHQSIEHVSIVYSCNTYFVIHWSVLFIWEYVSGQCSHTIYHKILPQQLYLHDCILASYCLNTKVPLFFITSHTFLNVINAFSLLPHRCNCLFE
mgnify:CR=1 FL=1